MIAPPKAKRGDALVCEVLWIDRYGNVQLNIGEDDLEPFGPTVRVVTGGRSRVGHRVESYAAINVGELGLVVDSYGLVSLAVDRASAAVDLGTHAGAQITLEPSEPDDAGAPAVRVELGRRPGGPR